VSDPQNEEYDECVVVHKMALKANLGDELITLISNNLKRVCNQKDDLDYPDTPAILDLTQALKNVVEITALPRLAKPTEPEFEEESLSDA